MQIGQLILGADFDPYHEDPEDKAGTDFLLRASHLPTQDPIPHVQSRLGESLHEDHVEEIVKRVRHFAKQARGLHSAVRRFPKMLLEKDYDTVDEVSEVYNKHYNPAFNAYYAAAKDLHLTDLQPISSDL